VSAVDKDQRVVKARERATVARLRFNSSLQSTQRRLSFGRLKEDAQVAVGDRVEQAKQDVRQTIRRHPFMIATGVAGLLAILFWKPGRIIALYGMRGAQLLWLNRRLWRQIDE